MHTTTREYLRAFHAFRTVSMFSPDLYSLQLEAEKALAAWSDAGYPDADPEPEAYRGVVADAVAEELEQLRAELEAARAEIARIDSVMARIDALDKPTRWENIAHAIATAGRKTDEAARLRSDVERLERERNAARAGLANVHAYMDKNRAELERVEKELSIALAASNHWRKTAEDLAARPRLRDRVLRWVGVPRG